MESLLYQFNHQSININLIMSIKHVIITVTGLSWPLKENIRGAMVVQPVI